MYKIKNNLIIHCIGLILEEGYLRVRSSKPISSERLRRNMNKDVLNCMGDISGPKYNRRGRTDMIQEGCHLVLNCPQGVRVTFFELLKPFEQRKSLGVIMDQFDSSMSKATRTSSRLPSNIFNSIRISA